MIDFDQVIRFIDRIQDADDLEALRAAILHVMDQLGFPSCCYTTRMPDSFAQPTFQTLDNWSPELIDAYFRGDGLLDPQIDPVINYCMKYPFPLVDGDNPSVEQFLHLAQTPPELMAQYTRTWGDFNLVGGCSLGFQGDQGDASMISLSFDREHGDNPYLAQKAALAMQLLLPHIHQRFLILTGRSPASQTPQLTPRELECLRWAADGKTAWEIGRILHISERTAVEHLKNATRKLGAVNRVQAVAKAVLKRLI